MFGFGKVRHSTSSRHDIHDTDDLLVEWEEGEGPRSCSFDHDADH